MVFLLLRECDVKLHCDRHRAAMLSYDCFGGCIIAVRKLQCDFGRLRLFDGMKCMTDACNKDTFSHSHVLLFDASVFKSYETHRSKTLLSTFLEIATKRLCMSE